MERTSVIPASERAFNRASLLYSSAASTSSNSLSFHYEIGRQYLELDSLPVPKHPRTPMPPKAALIQGSSRRPDTPTPQNIQFVHVSPVLRCNLCLSYTPAWSVPTSQDVLLQKKETLVGRSSSSESLISNFQLPPQHGFISITRGR